MRGVPGEEVVEVEPSAHDIVEGEAGLGKGGFEIFQRLAELVGARTGNGLRSDAAEQTMPNCAVFEDGTDHAAVERDAIHAAGRESEGLDPGDGIAIAGRAFDPGDRPVNFPKGAAHGFFGGGGVTEPKTISLRGVVAESFRARARRANISRMPSRGSGMSVKQHSEPGESFTAAIFESALEGGWEGEGIGAKAKG